jgi:hypothetical protein
MANVARPGDWETTPFTTGTALPFSATYRDDQFSKIIRGLVPEAMEDKWFFYFEDHVLYGHRSWTGWPVYKVTFRKADHGVQIAEALISDRFPDEAGNETQIISLDEHELQFEAAMLDFLIGALLLGEDRKFPKPPGVGDDDGVFQHMMTGTGYPEKEFGTSEND